MCDTNKNYSADVAAKQNAAYSNQAQSKGAALCGESPRPSLRHRLECQVQASASATDNTLRAITILRDHPEFEDFIWLIRSGLAG